MNPLAGSQPLQPALILYPFKNSRRVPRTRTPKRRAMASDDIRIRNATLQDGPVILHHRRSMFQDMGEGTAEDLDRMVEATAPWLARALADGSYQGWLAETADRRVVAGGGVLLSTWPAGPHDPHRPLLADPRFRLASPG